MGRYLPIRLLKHMFLTILVVSSAYILSMIASVPRSNFADIYVAEARGHIHLRLVTQIGNTTFSPTSTAQIRLQETPPLAPSNTSQYQPLLASTESTNKSVIEYRQQTTACSDISNIAFIKTHKTGSSTLRSIINRYGLARNTSFVYLKESKNGHIRYSRLSNSLRKKFLPPIGGTSNIGRRYNMSTVHIRFSREFFDTFMTPETKYITIIREPVEHWLSVISYFNFKRYAPEDVRKKSFEDIAAYLAMNAETVQKKTRGSNINFFRNNQAFDLGLSHENCRDPSKVENYVKYLEGQFELVLINEYFDESLVLLRRAFCWSWSDVLYISRNVQSRTHSLKNEKIRGLIRQNSMADQTLYDYFNKTLWRKISEYGPEFQSDLTYFRNLLEQVKDDCNVHVVKKLGKVFYQLNRDRSTLCRDLLANDQINRIMHRQKKEEEHKPKTRTTKDHENAVDPKKIVPGKTPVQLPIDRNEPVVGVPREPRAIRDARVACDNDPTCKKIDFSLQPDGRIKIITYRTRRNL